MPAVDTRRTPLTAQHYALLIAIAAVSMHEANDFPPHAAAWERTERFLDLTDHRFPHDRLNHTMLDLVDRDLIAWLPFDEAWQIQTGTTETDAVLRFVASFSAADRDDIARTLFDFAFPRI